MKKISLLTIIFLSSLSLVACQPKQEQTSSSNTEQTSSSTESSETSTSTSNQLVEWVVSDIIKEPVNDKNYEFVGTAGRHVDLLSYDEYLKKIEKISQLAPHFNPVDDETFQKGKTHLENVFDKLYHSAEKPIGERKGQESTTDQDRLTQSDISYYGSLIYGYTFNPQANILVNDSFFLDMEIDPNSIRIARSGENNVKFELVLVNRTTKQQYYYVTGTFGTGDGVESIEVTGATLLTDGAVARVNTPQY